jgi:hypothetical protein
MTQREAEPGERCNCGARALIVFVFEDGREVPWCGIISDED